MHHDTDERTAGIAGVVSIGVLAIGLTLTALEVPLAWLVWPLGYGVALPLAVSVAGRRADDPQQDDLDRLQESYVAGDIDDREFEKRLETVLEGDEHGPS